LVEWKTWAAGTLGRPVRRIQISYFLELEPRSKLHVSRTIQCAGDPPELRVTKGCIRQAKSWSVGEVEEFSTNLELHAFPYGNFFAQRDVGIVDAIGPEIGKVSRRISSYLISGLRKASIVENTQIIFRAPIDKGRLIHGRLMVADSRRNLRARNIRSLRAVG
jgi:hypothetical protein